MRSTRIVGLGFLAVVLAGSWFALEIGRRDAVVTTRYETLQSARADMLFARGWLPDILPASARNIRTANNLDRNTSEGEFHFSASEYSQFASHLDPYVPRSNPFKNLDKDVERMRSKGFEPRVYTEASSTWVFFCQSTDGYCEYKMWLHGT
jgi:hypothetical protein